MSTRPPRFARTALLTLSLAVSVAAPARAQDDASFLDLIRKGDYTGLAKKLRENVDLDKADPALRTYLRKNIEYLERGAKPAEGSEYVVLVRGAENDKAYPASPGSGGTEFLLPNTIRFQRSAWDARLKRITRYFTEATSQEGGDGTKVHELAKILNHHKGGWTGPKANSTRSVLISASVRPLPVFGPPFYVIRVPAERAIFNFLSSPGGEAEVLVPFWVLPNEIVARCETLEEVESNPVYKASKLARLAYDPGLEPERTKEPNVWPRIERNVRDGRPLLEGVEAKPAEDQAARGPGAPATADVKELARLTVPELVRRLPAGTALPATGLGRAALIAAITRRGQAAVEAELAALPAPVHAAEATRFRESPPARESEGRRGLVSALGGTREARGRGR